eukprot:267189-Amphidinium_carterae.1
MSVHHPSARRHLSLEWLDIFKPIGSKKAHNPHRSGRVTQRNLVRGRSSHTPARLQHKAFNGLVKQQQIIILRQRMQELRKTQLATLRHKLHQ